MVPIWDPSGQPAYRVNHMGPMQSPVAIPILVPYVGHMGPICACLLGNVSKHLK